MQGKMYGKAGPGDVVGWEKIGRLIGAGEDRIRRWMRIYGFPPPRRCGNQGQLTWSKDKVLEWCEENKSLFDSAIVTYRGMN